MSFADEKIIREYLSVDIPEIIIKETLDSTNTYLKQITATNNAIKENTVVIADKQTNGRGRTGNSFFSPNGGLYFSIFLRSEFNAKSTAFITAFSAVAVCRAIEKVTRKAPEIKWVNDIYIGKKKVCGILTESSLNTDGSLANIILGIGVNISLAEKDIPDEIKNKAGALYTTGNEHEKIRNILCAEILNFLLPVLNDKKHTEYIEEYKKRCMLCGKKISYTKNNCENQGIVEGIDENLYLIVKNETGEKIILSSGEIKITDWE